MDDKQRSQGIPRCETAWRLLSFRRTRLCVWKCFYTGILLALNKHIKRVDALVFFYIYKDKPLLFYRG